MDTPTKQRKARTALTLAQRIKVIERKEKGESTKSIAAAFGTGLTQIVNICANKRKFKDLEKGLITVHSQHCRVILRNIENFT